MTPFSRSLSLSQKRSMYRKPVFFSKMDHLQRRPAKKKKTKQKEAKPQTNEQKKKENGNEKWARDEEGLLWRRLLNLLKIGLQFVLIKSR